MGSEGCRIFPNSGNKCEDMKFIGMVNGRDLQTNQANAEFITHAVNSHEALLEACRASLKLLNGSAMRNGPTATIVETAIKLAEDGQ